MSEDERLAAIQADARTLLDSVFSVAPPSFVPLEASDPQLESIHADARQLLDDELCAPRSVPRRLPRGHRGIQRVAAASVALIVLSLAGAALAHDWLADRSTAQADRYLAEARSGAAAAFDEANQVEPPAYPRDFAALRALPPTPPSPAEAEAEPTTEIKRRGPDLAALDAQAYAALRAQNFDDATRLFELVVKRGGRSEYAELAYGELFALARRSGSKGLDDLWRRYLRRFPQGRYADGARAGLCRRASDDEASTCWADYIHEHPFGSARKQALRELGRE